MKILTEFKEFAMRGNVIDLAVGVIIGAAFGKVVGSLVNDIIMPPIGVLVGGMDFKSLAFTIREAVTDPATGKIAREAVTLKYGNFIQTLVDFTIVAFAIFMMVKAVMKISKKTTEETPAPPPALTKDQELLEEIRDLLKK
ncbi:MAG: large-conductance mechanosensitive channel protein MscL [bacterium]